MNRRDRVADLNPPYLQTDYSAMSGVHRPPTAERPYPAPSNLSLKRIGDNWQMSDDAESCSSAASSRRTNKNYTLLTKCIAELIGDFTFVFIGSLSRMPKGAKQFKFEMLKHGTMQGWAGGLTGPDVDDTTVHAALAHGITIFIIVATLGHISGGHFNPAVSLSIALTGKMPPLHVPFYWISQLTGGFLGSLLAVSILSHQELVEVQAGATLVATTSTWGAGLISEAVATFFLCHTILNTAVDTDKNVLAPLAIGLTLTIDIFAVGSVTGASMNPARSLGPNIVGSAFISSHELHPHFWEYHWIYWAGPFGGAAIAAAVHKTFESREERLVM